MSLVEIRSSMHRNMDSTFASQLNYSTKVVNQQIPHHSLQRPYNMSMLRSPRKSIFPYASYLSPLHLFRPMTTRPLPIQRQNQHQFLPPSTFRLTPPLTRIYNFTTSDVDAVLYGYLGDENNNTSMSHSLSGVKLPDGNKNQDRNNMQSIGVCDLPSFLSIKEICLDTISHKGIFAKDTIKKGTRFGPYIGKIIKPNAQVDVNQYEHSWEIFRDNQLLYYICSTQTEQCWMKFVNCARYHKEQNMQVVQKGGDIYYEVSVDIPAGDELLIWYGEHHTQYMGFPMALKNKDARYTPPVLLKENVTPIENNQESKPGSFPCNRCGKIFSYEYYREKHLKYTRCVDKGDRKFPCHLCQRSFEKKDRLRIHILHVHQKYRPHVCKTCGKRFSQSSSLNKHSRVHTGERPYSCPHCPKSFTASSILRTHLRQHNGERPFKCKFCDKAFASHAAHDSHVRRTHESLKTFSCDLCTKSFSMEFELNFHLSTHTRHELENSIHSSRYRKYSEQSDSSLIIDV